MTPLTDMGPQQPPPATPTPPVTPPQTPVKEVILNGVGMVALGGLITSVAFLLAYITINIFEPHYVLTSFLALLFSAVLIWSYDKTTNSLDSPMKGPVQAWLVIIFTISLLYGYQHSNVGILDSDSVKESVTLRSEGEIWFTSRELKKGSTVEVEVLYNKVKIFDGETLSPGKNNVKITSSGKLTFQAVVNAPVNITVTYK